VTGGGASALEEAVKRARRLLRERPGPVVLALDGRSGAGKSTFAAALARRLDACLIEGDDFYAGGVGILSDPPPVRAARCIDWQAQRLVLAALRRGQAASYHAFDWDRFDGGTQTEPTRVGPARIVILEGVYAARPELADLVDLRILLQTPDATRLARIRAREGGIGPWEQQWLDAEDWYFAQVAPDSGFDLVLRPADDGPRAAAAD